MATTFNADCATVEMASMPEFLKRPNANLIALPTELWDIVISFPDSVCPGTNILATSDLLRLRLVSRSLRAKLEPLFGTKYFSTIKVMITPWSLNTLRGIANTSLGEYVRELEVGPERLNPRLIEDFVNATDTFADIKRSWTYNDLHQDWKKTGYKSWKKDHMSRVRKLVQEQRKMESTHQDIALLAGILCNLPNLRCVRLVSSFANSVRHPKISPLGMRTLLHDVGEQFLPRRENPRPSFEPVLISYQMLVVHDRGGSHTHFETVTQALRDCGRDKLEVELQLFAKTNPPLRLYNANSIFYIECCSRLRRLVLDFGPLGLNTMAHNQEISFTAKCTNLDTLRIENGKDTQVSKYVQKLPRIGSWRYLQRLELYKVTIEPGCMMELLENHRSTLRWISLISVHIWMPFNKGKRHKTLNLVWKDILSILPKVDQLTYLHLENLTAQSLIRAFETIP